MDTDQVATGQSLNGWFFSSIRPFIKERVLELNSESGDFAALLLDQGIPLYIGDTEKENRIKLRIRFRDTMALREVYNIDLVHPDFEQRYSPLVGRFSSILALNLPHQGFYNQPALSNARLLLRTRGHLIVAMPAFTSFYSELEQHLDELKKFDRKFIKGFWGYDSDILFTRHFRTQFGLSVLTVVRKRV